MIMTNPKLQARAAQSKISKLSKVALLVLAIILLAAYQDNYYVRAPDSTSTGSESGTSYADAWRGAEQIDWKQLTPGDTLYFCGDFSGNAEHIDVDPFGPHGTEQNNIVVSGACVNGDSIAVPGRIIAPGGSSHNYGLRTMRRDFYRFEHLIFQGYSVLVLDSKGVSFRDVEIHNSPETRPGAFVDAGISTSLDNVRIYNAGRDGITQQERGHNAFMVPISPDTKLWNSNATFRTKQDFQTLGSSITVRNCIVDTTFHHPEFVGFNALNLYWNETALVENNTFVDSGGSGVLINTDDRYMSYNIRFCSATTTCPTGYSCDLATKNCENAVNDAPKERDPLCARYKSRATNCRTKQQNPQPFSSRSQSTMYLRNR